MKSLTDVPESLWDFVKSDENVAREYRQIPDFKGSQTVQNAQEPPANTEGVFAALGVIPSRVPLILHSYL